MRTIGRRGFLELGLAAAGAALGPGARPEGMSIPPGRGRFTFREWAGPALGVESHLPDRISPDAPVIIVMHGVGRNAKSYCDAWAGAAADGAVVVAPHFPESDFPQSRTYAQGNVRDAAGVPVSRPLWSFSAIEPLFDAVRTGLGLSTDRYVLFGHSAGAQFVHRFVWFVPEARFRVAVAANAGWYTRPDPSTSYPYGLKGVPETDPRGGVQRNVLLLLGEADTDPEGKNLRRSTEAEAQGPTRFDRGRTMLAAVEARAAEWGVPCGWRVETVPGTAHSGRRMSEAAWTRLRGGILKRE